MPLKDSFEEIDFKMSYSASLQVMCKSKMMFLALRRKSLFKISSMLPQPQSSSSSLHLSQITMAQLHTLSSHPFHSPATAKHQSIDALNGPLPQKKPSFHLLMAGEIAFSGTEMLSVGCAPVRRGCVRGEQVRRGKMATLSRSFLEINDSCAITLRYTEEGRTVCGTTYRIFPALTCGESILSTYLSG